MEEEVFKNAFIPKRLTEVVDVERDINLAKAEGVESLVYKTITGLKIDSKKVDTNKSEEEFVESSNSGSDSEEDECNSDTSIENEKSKFINSARPKHETNEEKKERKKAIKEQQAEKRKIKIKKHIKKRKEKISRKK